VTQRMGWVTQTSRSFRATAPTVNTTGPRNHFFPHKLIIDGLGRSFLEDIRDYPESGVARRYRRLGLSVRQGQKLKRKLLDDHLIEEREERTTTGRLRLIRLTEQGQGCLEEKGKAA